MTRPGMFGLLLALCCALISADEQYYCSWYGECGMGSLFPRTCVAKNITAQPINDTAAEAILRKKCPQFFENNGLYIEVYFLRYSFPIARPTERRRCQLLRIIMHVHIIETSLTFCRIANNMLQCQSDCHDGGEHSYGRKYFRQVSDLLEKYASIDLRYHLQSRARSIREGDQQF